MPTFKNAETTVKRRFSDFLGLHERLNGKFLHLGRIVPPAPEKSVVGRLNKHVLQTSLAVCAQDNLSWDNCLYCRYMYITLT